MFITRKAEFSASHICRIPELSDAENRRIFGDGANPHGHGHNYIVEVTVEGEPDEVTGMVLDLKTMKDILEEEVVGPMDHRFLNYEVPAFHSVIPTAENLALEIWRRLEPRVASSAANLASSTRLAKVRLFETEDLYVDVVRGDG